MYVKQIDLVPIEWPIDAYKIRAAYPNQSLPEYISDELSFELGYGPFVFNGYPPEYDAEWQNIEEITPVLKDGKYQQSYKITEKYTPEEKKAIQDQTARDSNKQQAESLLQQTDWTENQSVRNTAKTPHLVNGDEFDDYRVALRVIAVNPPVTVDVWPVKPDEQWSTQ